MSVFFPNLFSDAEQSAVRRTDLYAFAQRFRAMAGNRLWLGLADVGDRNLYGVMITEGGLPVYKLTVEACDLREYRNFNISRMHGGRFGMGSNLVSTKSMNYALRRVKEHWNSDLQTSVEIGSHTWMQTQLLTLTDYYLSNLLKNYNTDLKMSFNFYNETQEWLLRVISNMSQRADLPGRVENEIQQALKRYEVRQHFLKNIQEIVGTMFAREKWMVCRQPYGYIVTSFIGNPLVRLISDAVISGEGLDTNYETARKMVFTSPVRLYKRLEDVPSEWYDSLMASLHMQRASRESLYSHVTGIAPDNIFPSRDCFLMSNEGGWFLKSDGATSWIITDRD